MNGITIRQINTTDPEYRKVWELREEVLRRPLGLSLVNEDLSGEKDDIILVAIDGDTIAGCLMLQRKDKDEIKYRQMAVAAGVRGKGTGRLLMEAAEKLSSGMGYKKVVLHAREMAAGFYEKLGYRIVSDLFEEVSIPHYKMVKELKPLKSGGPE